MKFAIAYGYIVTANEEGIATVNSRIAAQLNGNGEVNKATKLLIHQANAAPDLLEALEEVLPDLQHYVATHGPGPDKRLTRAVVAIAKAKGE